MVTLTRVAALTVVIALAAFVGLQFANLGPDVGAPSPSPSPSEVSTPTPSATPSAVPSASLPPGCVNPPTDITTLYDQRTDPAGDVVACYGNAPLTLDAYVTGGGVVDCPGSVEPAWLYCPDDGQLQLVGETRKLGAPFLLVVVDPASGVSLTEYLDTNVRVTGHFDDPAAQSCREIEPFPGESPRPAVGVIENCRITFVVTQVVPLEP